MKTGFELKDKTECVIYAAVMTIIILLTILNFMV